VLGWLLHMDNWLSLLLHNVRRNMVCLWDPRRRNRLL